MAQDDMFDAGRLFEAGYGDVDELASQVISLICERQTSTASGARKFVLDYLMRAVLRRGSYEPALMLAELRGHRLTPDAIIDTYVPLVAQQLGDMWIRDELNFAQVTVGAMRLQSLLGEASAEMVPILYRDQTELAALVVVPEGEQHFLGASVLSAQLRRFGVAVAMSICEDEQQVLARVEMEVPNMVLFSVARVQALEVVERTVTKIKRAVKPSPVLALGGALCGDNDGIRKKTGVDLVTSTTKDVVGFCTKRLQALGKG